MTSAISSESRPDPNITHKTAHWTVIQDPKGDWWQVAGKLFDTNCVALRKILTKPESLKVVPWHKFAVVATVDEGGLEFGLGPHEIVDLTSPETEKTWIPVYVAILTKAMGPYCHETIVCPACYAPQFKIDRKTYMFHVDGCNYLRLKKAAEAAGEAGGGDDDDDI